MTSLPGTGFFGIAAAVLGAYLVLALLAPPLTTRFGRSALFAFAALPAATAVWAAALLPSLLDGQSRTLIINWIPVLDLSISLRIDALAAVMVLVIAGIGALVLLYSARYFPAGDDGLPKYAGSLLAFAGAMLGLVLADNLLLLVIFWELTGILSYLLIAHRAGKRSSRSAASQALMTTTAGGLAMLVGAVMLGEQAGTYAISAIVAAPPTGTTATVALVLLIVGGISKSAIVPFQFWLPGAMAAPTPASAYLHAATMVKAGIYLFARLAPAFAGNGVWQPVLITLGGLTMLYGAVTALRQRDLKLLLAFGTVSQLGLLTVLIGTGTPDALLAALALLVAHAAFKGALFFVVGIVDTAAGTRDLRHLSGVGRQLPVIAVLAVLASASMAGIPPLVGFVAKEAAYAGLLEAGTPGVIAVVVMALGSALTVAYTVRFLWGAFATKAEQPESAVTKPSMPMTVPTALLAGTGVVFGLVPQWLEPAVQGYARTAGKTHDHALALWHGFNLPLALSAAGIVAGAGIFLAQRRIEVRRQQVAAPGTEPGASYRSIVAGVDRTARTVTAQTQRGSLPVSLGAILLVLLAFPGTMLIRSGAAPAGIEFSGRPAELVLSLVVLILAVTTLRVRRALTAVLLVGGAGYAMAVLFILRGAPDLALTQILVETVTLVAALLVLTRLPDTAISTKDSTKLLGGNGFRMAIAVCVGALMTALTLIIPGSRTATPVSAELAGPSVDFGGGKNIVNVILVDVRGWDTFGEMLVLVAAATGVASLVFVVSRAGSVPKHPRSRRHQQPARPSPWLATDWMPRRSLLLEVVTRLIFHVIVIFSVYVLFVGHDLPGGGFAAGLIVGLALTLRYIAGGAYELGEAAPVDAGILMGIGLLLAGGTSAAGLFGGGEALRSSIFEWHVPVLGDLKFVTSTVFDIGVYLVVIGLVLDVLRSLGAGLDRHHAEAADADETGQSEPARSEVAQAVRP